MKTRPARRYLQRGIAEPPVRLLARWWVERFGKSPRTRSLWDAAQRPQYLVGLLAGADQAVREGQPEVCAFEMGVASGRGLLLLEAYAASVEATTGVRIHIYGFDSGKGLPSPQGHRNHGDWWASGDYPMDESLLRPRLSKRTTLVLGDVAETVPRFVREQQTVPIAFVAFDLDLYSSTRNALRLFSEPGSRMLRRVPLYFDDLHWELSHGRAGEQLAISEFNAEVETVRIDPWVSLRYDRPFPEAAWLDRMYQAHDLTTGARPPSEEPLREYGPEPGRKNGAG